MNEREYLAQHLWDATRAQDWEDFLPTVMTDMGSCLRVADVLIEKGWSNGKIEQQKCGVNIGDREVCRCIRGHGHDGLHACRHSFDGLAAP